MTVFNSIESKLGYEITDTKIKDDAYDQIQGVMNFLISERDGIDEEAASDGEKKRKELLIMTGHILQIVLMNIVKGDVYAGLKSGGEHLPPDDLESMCEYIGELIDTASYDKRLHSENLNAVVCDGNERGFVSLTKAPSMSAVETIFESARFADKQITAMDVSILGESEDKKRKEVKKIFMNSMYNIMLRTALSCQALEEYTFTSMSGSEKRRRPSPGELIALMKNESDSIADLLTTRARGK